MSQGKRAKITFFLFVMIIASLIPLAYFGWKELYSGFIETGRPVIVIVEPPKGIGRLPVSINVKLYDDLAGLDEVVVRTIQNRKSKVMLREKLGGRHNANLTIEFPGEESSLEPGVATISIRAFDRSFWSNATEKQITLRVDYQKPSVEMASTQHNVNQGGAQLAFYQAYDESEILSGIKVGSHTFPGILASGIDQDFKKHKNLHLVFYSIDLELPKDKAAVRIFAEDAVGNATSKSFFNRIRPARTRKVDRRLSQDFLRTRVAELMTLNRSRLEVIANEIGLDISYKTRQGSQARLVEQFNILNTLLREIDNNDIIKRLQAAPRFEKFFDGAFDRMGGVVTSRFGDQITYKFNEQPVAQHTLRGHVYRMGAGGDVFAVSDGIVAFVDNLGIYGKVVGIDHGLGISTVFASLGNIAISQGDRVETGDLIGQVGNTGLYGESQLYFEVRVHGIPVNPREWFDGSWYHAQVESKIIALKRQLGIPLY